jgi:16S rRNA (cytosine967-C5)-methyltransferase
LQEENDTVADDFLRENAEFRAFPCAAAFAAARIALDTGERLRLSPHLQGVDGFFAAGFVKVPSV